MKELIKDAIFTYIVFLLVAIILGLLFRTGEQRLCEKFFVADYLFLGLTRLVCEVK